MSVAYLLTGPQRGELVTRDPGEPGPGQVLVNVLHNGVCASELALWLVGPGHGTPQPFGHEPVAKVVACGAGVSLPVGLWVTGRIGGSYAQRVLADADDVVALPAGIDSATALGEPIGCVVDGLDRTAVRPGDRVAVIGAGFMGRIAIQLLAHSWVAAVVAIDTREDARRGALDDGADTAVGPDTAHGGSFDVVVEASGTQPGLDLATALAREHGVLSVLGYHQSARTVNMAAWNYKALDVVNAHVRDRARLRESTRRGLELVTAGRLDITRLITHRFPLDGIDGAFKALRDKPDGFVTAVIDLE
jgi:2-desacetyl-2-hydroxyethyl bacteriochlorophyllide A dehydrogenase